VTRLRVLGAAAVAALALPAAALAGVELRNVDASAYPEIHLTVVSSEASATAPDVLENGAPVTGLEARNLGDTKSVVLAIDRSRSMNGKPLADAIAAAGSFVGDKAQADRISLVAFGSTAFTLTRFSAATIDSDVALRTLALDETAGTALYDAIVLAARALDAEPTSGRVIVILTDGRDLSSSHTLAEAVRAARDAHASVYPIAIEGKQFSPGPLQRLATATGGTYYGVASSSTLASVYAKIAEELRRTWQVEYATAARPGDRLDLTARVQGGGSADAALTVPGDPTAARRAGPKPVGIIPGPVYRSAWGVWLVVLAAGLLVAAAVGISLSTPKGTWLKGRLEPFMGPERATGPRRALGPRERLSVLHGLFALTERALGTLHLWQKLEALIRRADLPLRAVEAAYLMLGSGFVLGVVATIAGAPSFVAFLLFVAGGLAPLGVFQVKANRRTRAFDAQLPDVLITVASSLKAGHSFKQSLQTVVDEAEEPASKEFQRALNEARLGRPLEEALEEMVGRVGSQDLEFVVTAVNTQTQVGGSLAGLFDMVADTVRQRQQFARKVRSLTAMGRASAWVLVAMPFVLAAALTALNSEYMKPLFETSTGHLLLIAGLSMMAFGSLILRQIVQIRG
jgi:tight adherence protein B